MVRALRKKVLVGVILASFLIVVWFLVIERKMAGEILLEPAGVQLPHEPTFPRKEPRNGFTEDSYRVVHLDFKGAPPKMEYLRKLLPELAAEGCDALLIEYEDMFPYTDSLVNISAKNAYTRQEVRKMLSWAHDLGMEVIPLIQTFGHLEYVLKQKEWKGLRELPDFPGEVCPSNKKSIELIEEMITQVVGLHKGLKYIHLGADEVFHIGACSQCSQSNPRELFTSYVTEVAQIVHRKFPGVTPIIWDDMMRSWVPNFLIRSPLITLIEPMVWAYAEDVTSLIPHYIWYWYSKTFKRVWIASAYKGASLPTSDLPDITTRFKNTQNWLKLVQNAEMTIAGFVLTGWSRFDHFATLCELLPTSVPSLLLSLVAISRQHTHKLEEQQWKLWRNALHCSPTSSFSIHNFESALSEVSACEFPGVDLYNKVHHYILLKVKVDSLYQTMTQHQAWMTKYNVRHNFTSTWRLINDYSSLEVHGLYLQVRKFKTYMRKVLQNYLDSYGADEWIEQRIQPLEDKLNYIGKTVESLISRQTWPRRPLGR